MGGRPRASISKETDSSFVSEAGTGYEVEQGVPVGRMEAHVFSHENPV